MTSRWTLAGLAMLLVATGPGGTITRADSGPYTVQDLGLPGLESFLEPVAQRALQDNVRELMTRLFESATVEEEASDGSLAGT